MEITDVVFGKGVMTSLKIVIAEKEVAIRKRIRIALETLTGITTIFEVENCGTLEKVLNTEKIELLITNFTFGGEAGYIVIKEFCSRSQLAEVIYYTECTDLQEKMECGLKGFEFANAVILLEMGVDWLCAVVKKHIEKRRRSSAIPVKVPIVCGDVTYLLGPDEIIFIEKMNKHLNFHTAEKEFITFGTLTEIEKRIPGYFFRSHRSYLINPREIQAIFPAGRSYLVKFCQINQKAILSYDRQRVLMDILL